MLAPAGTPREIVMKLHGSVVRALQDPAIKQRFIQDGADPTPSATPEAFRDFIRAEMQKWERVIREAHPRGLNAQDRRTFFETRSSRAKMTHHRVPVGAGRT